MNEQERAEFEQLKERQGRLQLELSQLANHLQLLEQRLERPSPESPRQTPLRPTAPESRPVVAETGSPLRVALPPKPAVAEVKPPVLSPIPIPPPPIPPVIPARVVVSSANRLPAAAVPPAQAETVQSAELPAGSTAEPAQPRLRLASDETAYAKAACQFCGGHIEFPASATGDMTSCPYCGQSTRLYPASTEVPIAPALPKSASAGTPPRAARPSGLATQAPAQKASLEMRFGTYWAPRIGIVILLTGLVFFGNLAYHKIISHLGPAGKVSLLYLASGLLLGAGAWWQRKAANESLKNYAQVLFAGGLAAVYFTTYAAHHLAQVQVIQSPLLDGVLLLAWAGYMVWVADHKKSEVLALFAVGLAYYTSIITHVGYFTLYSNLVLTAAAVFFLVRNRWATLSFGSLVATYAAYGFWRFFDGSDWHWASPDAGLWSGTWFLLSYWVVFTAAVFLSRSEKFAGQARVGFLTVNNGAFFTMFLLTMLQVRQGGFWKFMLIYGSALLALAALARRVLPAEPVAKNSYLTQGLLLVTVGIISHPKLAGLQLALVLALESVTLLFLGQQRKNLILLTGAYIAAGLAVGWGIDGMRQTDRAGLWLAVGLGLLMMTNAFLAHRQAAPADGVSCRPQPSYFTVLALAVWLVATWNNTVAAGGTHPHFPLVLAVEALVLTLSIYLLRVPEIPLLSQGYMVLAQAAWLFNDFEPSRALPWWDPLLLLGLTLMLSHWWQRQKTLVLRSQFGVLCQGLYALALVAVLYVWLCPKVGAPAWLALTSLMAVGLTAYGVLTRAWWVAVFGQVFLLVSAGQFAWQLAQAKPHWPLPLAPMAALGLLSFSTVRWFARGSEAESRVREPLLQLAMLYRWVALGMSIWWVCAYIPERERIWLLALLGLWVFLWAGFVRSQEALLASAAYTVTALVLFWLPLLTNPDVYWPNLLVILVLLAQRQFARRLPERYPLAPGAHNTVIVVGGLSLWLFLSRWVLREQPGGFYLTASWSLLALAQFAAGILLRERMYRWVGLGILACTLGRVVIFDVWTLQELYRILSFMALGLVLLVLGFIYNRYQEKIREWL